MGRKQGVLILQGPSAWHSQDTESILALNQSTTFQSESNKALFAASWERVLRKQWRSLSENHSPPAPSATKGRKSKDGQRCQAHHRLSERQTLCSGLNLANQPSEFSSLPRTPGVPEKGLAVVTVKMIVCAFSPSRPAVFKGLCHPDVAHVRHQPRCPGEHTVPALQTQTGQAERGTFVPTLDTGRTPAWTRHCPRPPGSCWLGSCPITTSPAGTSLDAAGKDHE